MDLAKVAVEWRSQPPEQWLAQINRVLPPLAVAALVILLAFQAAGLTWRLLAQPAQQDELPPAVMIVADRPQSGGGGVSFESLRGWEPFGAAPDTSLRPVTGAEVIDAEPTRRDLKLFGWMQAQALPERDSVIIPERGSAIIGGGSGGYMFPYETGADLRDGNGNPVGVRLHSVFEGFVLLDPGGGQALEKLEYEQDDAAAQSSVRPGFGANRNTATPFRAPQSFSTPEAAAAAVSGAAAAFAQHIQPRLQEEGGEIIGFRLEPRNDSPVLSRLGLEPGDILTEVNGRKLGELRSPTALIQLLGESPQANVMIRRNGVDQPMSIDIGQIQRLAESLQ